MIQRPKFKMTDTTKRVIKGLMITCIVIAVPLGLINLWGRLCYKGAKEGRIDNINYKAEVSNYYVSEYLSGFDVSDETTYILQGEYGMYHFLVYANDLDSENTMIYESNSKDYQQFWAAKITGTTVVEVWTSKKELTESDLHPYTLEEQENSVHFVPIFAFIKWHRLGWVDDTDLVGYYKND